MISQELLEILACPKCHTKVECKADRLAFPVKDDIPVMLIEEAKPDPDQG